MWIARTVDELRSHRADLLAKKAGRIGFVPTMGALHAGHLSLVEAAKQMADHVLVSVYVNPTQFGPSEDFQAYPRPIDVDLKMCEDAGVAGVFVPGDGVMYPAGVPECTVDIPALSKDLEGEFRPGHFNGVCRVVSKLLNILQPDVACFGRKDYQQLKVIEAMAADLMMPVRIVGCPTMREQDGLAMSSRNQYLNDETRKQGLGLFKALSEARALVEEGGETDPEAVEAAMRSVLTAYKVAIDYAVVRHPQTLAKLDIIEPELTGGVVALIAGKVGNVRLIDNMVLAER